MSADVARGLTRRAKQEQDVMIAARVTEPVEIDAVDRLSAEEKRPSDGRDQVSPIAGCRFLLPDQLDIQKQASLP
jgi:hypothetical protein